VDGLGKNHAKHHLDVRLVGFDPETGGQLRDDGCFADGVGDANEGAVAHYVQAEVFAAASAVRLLEGPLRLRNEIDSAISLSETPRRNCGFKGLAELRGGWL